MTTGAPVKHLYREAMEQVHTYNSKLLLERRLRMPYIDNQTGLAQQDCHLWVSRVQRCAPIKEGQIYSYPSRRWMVRKRPDFIGSSKLEKKNAADGEDVGGKLYFTVFPTRLLDILRYFPTYNVTEKSFL